MFNVPEISQIKDFVKIEKEGIVEYIPSMYSKNIPEGEYTNIFYMPKCKHCEALRPKVNEMLQYFKEKNIDMPFVATDMLDNDSGNLLLSTYFKVAGAPTLLYQSGGVYYPFQVSSNESFLEKFPTFVSAITKNNERKEKLLNFLESFKGGVEKKN